MSLFFWQLRDHSFKLLEPRAPRAGNVTARQSLIAARIEQHEVVRDFNPPNLALVSLTGFVFLCDEAVLFPGLL